MCTFCFEKNLTVTDGYVIIHIRKRSLAAVRVLFELERIFVESDPRVYPDLSPSAMISQSWEVFSMVSSFLINTIYATKKKSFEIRVDLPYGQVEGESLLLDLYLPEDDGQSLRPAIIAIHGGGWQGGDKGGIGWMAEMLARRGYVVVAADYRLAPRWTYPAHLDDVQRAVRWLRKHAQEFRIDSQRIGAIGDSAGGHLSALLGTRETRDDSDPELQGFSSKVQCVVDIYGPADLPLPRYLNQIKTPDEREFLRDVLLAFIGKPYDEAPDLWHEASPLFHVSPDDAPFFIIHGTDDMIVPLEQSTSLAEVLKKAGVEVELVIIKGMGHGPQDEEKHEQFIQALEKAMNFFDKHLRVTVDEVTKGKQNGKLK